MKKATQEWEQKYYEEKAWSINILQEYTKRIVDVSSSTKPVPALKVESVLSGRNTGKEVVQEPMQTSNEWRSNSMEADDELSIQYGSRPPSDF